MDNRSCRRKSLQRLGRDVNPAADIDRRIPSPPIALISLRMVESPIDHADQLAIGPSKAKRLAMAALAAACFGVPALLPFFAPHRPSGVQLPGIIVVSAVLLIAGAGVVALLAKRAFGGTIVTLSRAGLRDTRLRAPAYPPVTDMWRETVSTCPRFAITKSWPMGLVARARAISL